MSFNAPSLRVRLIFMSLAIVITSALIMATIAYVVIGKRLEAEAERDLRKTMAGVQGAFEKDEHEMLTCASLIATRTDLIEAVAAGNTTQVRAIAKSICDNEKFDVLTIADAAGKVLGRGHSETLGDSVLSQANVKLALQGKDSTGYESGTAVKLALRAGHPITQNGKIIGSITTGVNISSKSGLVDRIKNTYDCECSIFSGTERVSTSLSAEGKRLVGSKIEHPATEQAVLTEGQDFFETRSIAGTKYEFGYWPLKSPDGKIVGMIAL